MKHIITLLLFIAVTTCARAQMHGAMTFAGEARFYVTAGNSTMGETDIPSDTLLYDGTGNTFTLPPMTYGNMIIPSFTISGATQTSAGYSGVTWEDTSFTSTTPQGKTITGSSLRGSFTHDEGIYNLRLDITFLYGSMPMPITYSINAYYVKSTTKPLAVKVAGAEYQNESVTYDARLYRAEGETLLDIAIHEYCLQGTVMGDLTLGAYTIRGLAYNEAQGGYWRDYSEDGLSFRFTTSGGIAQDYTFTRLGNILVKMSGTSIDFAENNFQPGSMPFPICSLLGTDPSTDIGLPQEETSARTESPAYDLNGVRVCQDYRGIIIRNGKKYLKQ
ncbi:MAG: hypothetical protein ACI4UA_01800 [Bacteroidaceae bacterium]